MGAAKIIDLDKIIVDTFTVRLGGEDYILPRSVPLVTAFGMMKLFGEVQGEDGEAKATPDQMERLFDYVTGLFAARYADMTNDKLKAKLSFQQANMLLREVVSEIFAQEEEAGNP